MDTILIISSIVAIAIVIFVVCACVRISAMKNELPDHPTDFQEKLFVTVFRRAVKVLRENDENYIFKDLTLCRITPDETLELISFRSGKVDLREIIKFSDDYGVSVDYLLGRKDTEWL